MNSTRPYRIGSRAYRTKIMENHFRNCYRGFHGSCARCTRVYIIIKLRHSVSAAVPVWFSVTSRPQNVVLPSSHVSLVRSLCPIFSDDHHFPGEKTRKYPVNVFIDNLRFRNGSLSMLKICENAVGSYTYLYKSFECKYNIIIGVTDIARMT